MLIVNLVLVVSVFGSSPFIDMCNGGPTEMLVSEICRYLVFNEAVALCLTCNLLYNLVQPRCHPISTSKQDALFDLIQSDYTDDQVEKSLEKELSSNNWYDLGFTRDGKSLLFWTVFNRGSLPIVRLLHKKGFNFKDPNIMRPVLECIQFCRNGYRIFKYLVDYGCVLAEKERWNFLKNIVLLSKEEYFISLKEAGRLKELINIKDDQGRTPLFYITRTSVATSLILHDAHVYVTDCKGMLPWEFWRQELGPAFSEGMQQLSMWYSKPRSPR